MSLFKEKASEEGARDVEGEGDGLRAPRPLLVEGGGARGGTRPLRPKSCDSRVSSGRGRKRRRWGYEVQS